LATYIDSQNKLIKQKIGDQMMINLKGVAIGNGWVDPMQVFSCDTADSRGSPQNQAYVDYPYNLGLIDSFQKSQAQAIQDQLVEAILDQQWLLANNLSNDLEAFVMNGTC
jgi:hypothetical protein